MTVEQIIAKVFNIEPEEVSDFSSQNTIEEWDSMGHLTLILELEKQFKVSIAIADAVEMVNVAEVKDILRRYRVNC